MANAQSVTPERRSLTLGRANDHSNMIHRKVNNFNKIIRIVLTYMITCAYRTDFGNP